ncbi:Hypothetical predicted protein [Cloeon dipterum]|uniref:BTB domain-containing protein n=1 Tax=Cloeon dipterum TaxID=197152 RepID=A0A8S1DPT6_9INSE|nr:Hypothetical predicted protein [Cloeon dipterum]
MSDDSLDEWEIFQELSDELKRKIRLAVVYRGGAIYVTKDDEVFGFGKNLTGFLGTGDKQSRTEHTKIEQLCGQNIQDLQFAYLTFFAISATGSVYAWGKNDNGQLGLGTKKDTWIPTKIEGNLETKRVVQVACSDYHTLVLTSDREVFSFGWNKYGQLGLGHNEDQSLPKKLDFFAAGGVVTAVACLVFSSLALLDSGQVFVWGKNEDGILGHSEDDVEKQNIPRKVPGLEGITITRIVCGLNHALALSNDGKVYSWGWNGSGQLGNGTDENSHEPTLIFGIGGRIRDVASNYNYSVSVAITEADDVIIWGWLNGSQNKSPTKTSFKSLDEVFAKLPILAFTFRPLRLKLNDDPIVEKNTANESPEWLKKYFNDADTADIVFVVEGKKIYAHKTILLMRCAVFRTMFQGNWKESNESEQIIKHHSYDVFFAFLRYFYTNQVDMQPVLALELFALAHFYQMTDLQKESLKIIERGVTVENAASIYDRAILLAAEVPTDLKIPF